VAAGALTVDQIRNGSAEACTLLSEAVLPGSDVEAGKPAPPAPMEHLDDAAELLLDMATSLLLGGAGEKWNALAELLDDELFDRLDAWVELRLA
jgi:hypothetical protein